MNIKTKTLGLAIGLSLSIGANAVGTNYHGHGIPYRFHHQNHLHPSNLHGHFEPWSPAPNVVITLPPRRAQSIPLCETVEVCNYWGECWLERECE